ncbi:MAG: class I SAM-dependent methyltransferase [Actinomycetota bacterium]|nr:class I SAM-dependent methyltransferase [Actinomycetota bacterium]
MSSVLNMQRAVRTVRRRQQGISYHRAPSFHDPISQACTFDQIESPEFRTWCARLHTPRWCHRKLWEWCFILQALTVNDMAAPGRRGLGFAVGNEPISAWLAACGATLVATDLPDAREKAAEWKATGQHAARLADLVHDDICPADQFLERVSFRPVDMNDIPADLRDFDFAWSACAIEHLGDLEAGLRFFERQLDCLAPGGVGVHTTEFNVSSDDATLADGHTVLYRRRDIEELVTRVQALGHDMRVTFALGETPEDLHVDLPPYTNTHLRMKTADFVNTSFGLIVRKAR